MLKKKKFFKKRKPFIWKKVITLHSYKKSLFIKNFITNKSLYRYLKRILNFHISMEKNEELIPKNMYKFLFLRFLNFRNFNFFIKQLKLSIHFKKNKKNKIKLLNLFFKKIMRNKKDIENITPSNKITLNKTFFFFTKYYTLYNFNKLRPSINVQCYKYRLILRQFYRTPRNKIKKKEENLEWLKENDLQNFLSYKFYCFMFYTIRIGLKKIFYYIQDILATKVINIFPNPVHVSYNDSFLLNSNFSKKLKKTKKTKPNFFLKKKKKAYILIVTKKLKKTKSNKFLRKRKWIKRKKKSIFFTIKLDTKLVLIKRINTPSITNNLYFKQISIVQRRFKKSLTFRFFKNKKKKVFKHNIFFKKKRKKKNSFLRVKTFKYSYIRLHKCIINFKNINSFLPVKYNNIRNLLLLNKFSVKSFYIDFYLKNKKKKKLNIKRKKRKKLFFFNFWKKKLVSFKRSRQVHWSTFFKKTIKKRRYKIFLKRFLKQTHKWYTFIITSLATKFKFSFVFWKQFSDMYLSTYQIKMKDKVIFQLPVNSLFWIFLKKYQSKKKKISIKIKKLIKKKKLIRRRFWMNRKKKIPNFFSKQIFYNQNNSRFIQYDFLTNYFIMLKTTHQPLSNLIHSNKVIKLNNFRYKA